MASSSTSKVDVALAMFKGGKGCPKSASGNTDTTDKQAEQKRAASKRDHRLKSAPEHVRAKWDAICELKGRDRLKNNEKTNFTQLILNDTKFEDVYWQTEVFDSYCRKTSANMTWILRSKADTEHGGGPLDARRCKMRSIVATTSPAL